MAWARNGTVFSIASDVALLKSVLAIPGGHDGAPASSESAGPGCGGVGKGARLDWFIDVARLAEHGVGRAYARGGGPEGASRPETERSAPRAADTRLWVGVDGTFGEVQDLAVDVRGQLEEGRRREAIATIRRLSELVSAWDGAIHAADPADARGCEIPPRHPGPAGAREEAREQPRGDAGPDGSASTGRAGRAGGSGRDYEDRIRRLEALVDQLHGDRDKRRVEPRR